MTSKKSKTLKNPLLWVVDPIMEEPSYIEHAWFGCRSIYLHGRLVLVLCPAEEPWNGLLIPTEHAFHDSIRREFADAVQHPFLKKWLYLSQATEDFESVSSEIVEAVRRGDERFGVEPKPKKRNKKHDSAGG